MHRPAPNIPNLRENDPAAIRHLRWMLLFLVFELTFEGLARKLNIGGTNMVIFLLKDVVVAAIGVQVLRLRRPPSLDFFWMAYLTECILFIPVIIQTAAHDPVLAVFGAKQYLLYPIVAFAVFIVFEKATLPEILKFFRWICLLVIPTTLLALVQLRLPASNWLNLSIDGGDLSGFSAGGHLRVSSTFSFVAQYCAFLNAEVFIVALALSNMRDLKWFWKLVYLSTVPLLIISSYITGSRGAVLVNCVIIAIAAGLSLMKFQVRSAMRVVVIIGALLITLGVAQYAVPDAFEAYSTREDGRLLGAGTEIQGRVYGETFDWMSNIVSTPFFGSGLGVMSNGSEVISGYAASERALAWTESDFATTLYEGGVYLIIIWFGFRYFVIYQMLRRFFATLGGDLSLPAAFCLGFVITVGLTGTLGIQPPIAIWWWFSVGTSLVLWWKSVEPKQSVKLPEPAPPKPGEKIFRGQSAYAERLHGRKR